MDSIVLDLLAMFLVTCSQKKGLTSRQVYKVSSIVNYSTLLILQCPATSSYFPPLAVL